MQSMLLPLFAALTASVSADFFLSNSTTCMGAFPVSNCYHNVVVISGVSNITDYTCSKLTHAQDHSYITNGSAGPNGDGEVWSANACGAGKLKFTLDNQAYFAEDESGNHVADCVVDNSLQRHCSQWIGAFFFETEFRCTSSINCE